MILIGTVVHNLGVASITTAKQKAFFRKEIPDITQYRNGTINVLMTTNLGEIIKYDYYFDNLQWDDNNPSLKEDFGFIKIKRLIHNNEIYNNWGFVYFPMKSPNRNNKRLIELFGKNVPDIQVGDVVDVIIEDGYIK